jgi:23S rRNA maturation-related 3'-5' exoribonuclease YhaM
VSVKKAKNNNEYTEFTLKDKSGSVFAKLWSVDPLIKKGMYVSAVVNVDDYMGAASFIIRSIKEYDKEVKQENYVAVVEDINSLIEQFDGYARILKETSEENKLPLSNIFDAVFTKEFKDKFFKSPSGLGNYYGKVGGALENTVNICKGAMNFAGIYGFSSVDKAVLLTSALLSLIGSVDAYTMNDCAVEKTIKGELFGPAFLSASILNDAWKSVKKSEDDEIWFTKVYHAVTSNEGSGNIPMTKESILLKNVIMMDSKMSEMFDYIYRDEHIENGFTTFDTNGKRCYFVG